MVALPTSNPACRTPATGGKPVTMPGKHHVPATPGRCRTRGQGPSFVSGLTLAVEAVIAFKVGDDHESIAAAARRFQGDQSQMPVLVGRIFSGHLRSIIGSMTVEAIIRMRRKRAERTLLAAMARGDLAGGVRAPRRVAVTV